MHNVFEDVNDNRLKILVFLKVSSPSLFKIFTNYLYYKL
jgi:hypothetical protein